ncbi:hypothetical protein SAMN05421810_102125 [Amycolatopsis arida]|uniref:Uncharacterized protein n=1 Tax=Amycolatopsis arida TaxID=587909 RepID=A0A1I5P2Q6_9PSEU|nr:oxygenase MpaB family protein [Amycolatopsis arida]TDX98333.1 uncharacterized protein DUF2236 [Amycolatopsis arida]SFP28319.1 hypothetical protein SAMN05421810_102125 [Amycolatopsis arida]
MRRYATLRRILALDPARDFERIYRITTTLEFPWDTTQALSLALFRTYAVPSIGGLLARTGEFTRRAQKRYDDTTLILDAVIEHGMDSRPGRTAIRRMNQMHGAYPIGNADMRYVLATFVVCPIRWIDRFGWRPLAEAERVAMANFYRALGRRMGIRDIPATHQEFALLLDEHERVHFRFDRGGREVADATLDLLATFRPFRYLPAPVVRRVVYALLDDGLLAAFDFPRPGRVEQAATTATLRARARLVRLLPPRSEPRFPRESSNVRGCPGGYDIARLGTFPRSGRSHTDPSSTPRVAD